MLKKIFKVTGERGRAVRIAQFINDHRRFVRFFEQPLRDPRVRINATGIDSTHATARDGGDVESPVFATGREQLDGVARFDFEEIGQSVADNHTGRVVPKIVEVAVYDLFGQIGRAQM